jgi:hypothetical protein
MLRMLGSQHVHRDKIREIHKHFIHNKLVVPDVPLFLLYEYFLAHRDVIHQIITRTSGSIPDRGKRFFSLPNYLDLASTNSFLFNGYRGLFSRGYSGRIANLTTHGHLTPKLSYTRAPCYVFFACRRATLPCML